MSENETGNAPGGFPSEDMELTHLLVVSDMQRSRSFYQDVLGADLYREYGGTSAVFRFFGSWLLLVTGGGPTPDKPGVVFAPPAEVKRLASELGAIPFDVEGVELSHDGPLCSFDALLAKYGLDEPALQELAIIIRGADKEKVGQVAAEIRALRKPDPYKQKGVRYAGERIRKKAGKASK